MRTSQLLSLSGLVAAALGQVGTEERIKQICSETVHNMEQPFLYILGWSQYGNIGSGGDPEIGSTGGVWITNRHCDIVGNSAWNGGSGTVRVDFDGDVDGRDERIAGHMANAALLNTWEVPAEPSDIMYDHNGGQAAGDQTQSRFHCGGNFNDNEFAKVTYWRVCTFTPVCDDCPCYDKC